MAKVVKNEELQKLLENGGVVRSAFDGVVDKLNIGGGIPPRTALPY